MSFFRREQKNKKQLEAVWQWLSAVAERDDLILLELDGERTGYFFEFPLRIGDKPKKLESANNREFSFFIRFFSDDRCRVKYSGDKWRAIFQMPVLEVWANRQRILEKRLKPLFLGLDTGEKTLALKIARKAIEVFLKEKRRPKVEDLDLGGGALSSVFYLKSDLDVALWVDGKLRGSSVIEGLVLREAIIDAAVLAARDMRFKPLKIEEFLLTQIEITIFSDLRIPLNKELIAKDEIFYNKGYLLKRGENQGWFLPEVFNVTKFKDLKEFLFRLAGEKARLPPEIIFDKKTKIYVFEVEDFIEGTEAGEILDLDGPIVIPKVLPSIEEAAFLAADWLIKIQEPDGNFPPIINPITGAATQIDWPRGAFCGWSLAEFGKATGRETYTEAARKNFFYLKKYLLEESVLGDPAVASLALAYFGQLALSLNYWLEARQCVLKISQNENRLKFEPILWLQTGSFFAASVNIDRNLFEPALKYAESSRQIFANNLARKREMNLAIWAEIINLYIKIFQLSPSDGYLKTISQFINWILPHQLPSGAFKNSDKSDFAYTRGTGKIAEVLAAIFMLDRRQFDGLPDFTYYKKCLDKSFVWLVQMQYTAKNIFFVPENNLKNIIGGFRHDCGNPDLWIDSAGHFLLAASRILRAEQSR